MIKYVLKTCVFVGAVSVLGACQNTNATPKNSSRAQEWQPQIDMPSSVVVCRDKECAPARLSMSREYVYNSLTHLLEQNAHEKALICQADPLTHVCTEDYVTLPITVGVTPAHLYINDVEITDVSLALNRRSIDLILNYGISYNGQTPTCKPAQSLVYVKNAQNIVLEDTGYKCKMTTIGNTTIKTLFAIDYIDLDYGFIGGYYSIGLSGPAYGGGSRYMMFRLKNNSATLAPDLTLKGLELKEKARQEEEKTKEEAFKAQQEIIAKQQETIKVQEETMKAQQEALKDQSAKEKELQEKEDALNQKASSLNEREARIIAQEAIMDEHGEAVYVFGEDNTIFEGSECYSTVLEPMPCYEQWPCYKEPAVEDKVICPEPKVQNFTIITEEGEEIKRSKGVIEPKPLSNINSKEPLDTREIQPVKQRTTTLPVYDTPAPASTKGTEYNGVQVFPIYKRKK